MKKETRQQKLDRLREENRELLESMRIQITNQTIPVMMIDSLFMAATLDATLQLLFQKKLINSLDFLVIKEEIMNQILGSKKEADSKRKIEIPGNLSPATLKRLQLNIPQK